MFQITVMNQRTGLSELLNVSKETYLSVPAGETKGRKCIALKATNEDYSPFAMLTVYLHGLGIDEMALNHNLYSYGESVIAELHRLGLIESTEPKRHIRSGFVDFPVYEFTYHILEIE